MVTYVDPQGSDGGAGFLPRALSMGVSGGVAATLGDVDGSGTGNLVVWKAASGVESIPGNVVEVYRVATDVEPQEVARMSVPGGPGIPEDAQVLVGDVDGAVPGNEIVVGGANMRGGMGRLCAVGGLEDGQMQVIADFAPLLRAAGREPFTVALGDVVPGASDAAQEIVVGGRGGRVQVFGLRDGRPRLIRTLSAFPDSPRTSARRLAVGDLIPDRPGDEIAVGDDGTNANGEVRVFDGSTGAEVLELQAFPVQAPAGVELWIGDVLPDVPGDELIVGQGSTGGALHVFSLASGFPRYLVDVPDVLHRATTLHSHVALGQFFVDRPGLALAVAQSDAGLPVQIFSFASAGNYVTASLDLSDEGGTINAIVGAR